MGGGDGNSKTRARAVSANKQAIAIDGASSLQCEIDTEVRIEMLEDAKRWMHKDGVIESQGSALALCVDGNVIAILETNGTTRKMASCMGRGFSYSGQVIAGDRIRVQGGDGD